MFKNLSKTSISALALVAGIALGIGFTSIKKDHVYGSSYDSGSSFGYSSYDPGSSYGSDHNDSSDYGTMPIKSSGYTNSAYDFESGYTDSKYEYVAAEPKVNAFGADYSKNNGYTGGHTSDPATTN